MPNERKTPFPRRRIALIAHDAKKRDIVEWAGYNLDLLSKHELCATGTTGSLLEKELGLEVHKLQSGPFGGDQQVGAMIAQGDIDLLIFFWDPLTSMPHETDVQALLRLAVVWNIPVAGNRATADYLISSPLMSRAYQRQTPDHAAHTARLVDTN